MKINRIKLKNFRQFEDCTLEFSNSSEKNVTVILGDNTYGKTTLVRAFIWCLYGDKSQFTDKTLLNNDVVMNMPLDAERSVEVQIDLEHEGKDYRVITSEIYKKDRNTQKVSRLKRSETKLYITTAEGTKSIQDTGVARTEINKILSSELKDYFFFDGENNRIDKVARSRNLEQAVSDLTGLKKVETLRDFYNPSTGVVAKLRQKLKLTDEGLISDYQQQLIDAQTEYSKSEVAEMNAKEEKDRLQDQLDEKNSLLDANLDITEKQERKKTLEASLKAFNTSKVEKYDSMIKSLNGRSFLKGLFGYSYRKFDFKNIVESSSFSTENSISHISEEAIDQLVARGYCLCGTPITNESDAYKHLMEAKLHMEPNDFGKIATDFIDAENQNILYSDDSLSTIKEAANKLLEYYELHDAEEEEYRMRVQELEGRLDVGELQRDIGTINQQIGVQSQIIINAKENKEKAEKAINNINDEIEKYRDKSEANERIEEMIGYAQYIYELASKKLKIDRANVIKHLNEDVQAIFNAMFHGNREITINDDFSVITKANSNKLDESNGLETVKNYAFVAALLKSVKDKLTNDDMTEDDEDEVYPLVLDAPFSDTDNVHIENVCRELPKYCDQIIMFVMEKDYAIAKDALEDHVGEVWKLVKNTETDVEIERVA